MASETTKSSAEDPLLDKPISQPESDQLGFGELTHAIADVVHGQPNSSSLILGLDGPWGSGKSSMLQLLEKELDSRRENQSKTGIGLIVVLFSPWLVTNRTALISSFFGELHKAIQQAARQAYPLCSFRSIGKRIEIEWLLAKLHRFNKIVSISAAAFAPFDPSGSSGALASSFMAISQLTKPADPSLQKQKREIVKKLSNVARDDTTFRVLVLIDDLDRLDPQDAIEVLRLVKAVADFPAVTYLLSYDRNALADAIVQNRRVSDGNAYMEKILQFTFKIPPLEPFRLRQWLRDEVERHFPNQVDYSSIRTQAVLDVWAGRLLKTPRDLKRILFAVRATWNDLESKADLVDLIWLQMVKEKAGSSSADLYRWLTRYLQSLDAIALGARISGQKQEGSELAKILKVLGWRSLKPNDDSSNMDMHYLDKILAGVTRSYLHEPVEDQDAWTHRVGNEELQAFREAKRLASPWHWRLYFALQAPSHALTDDEWAALEQVAEKTATDYLVNSILTLLSSGTEGRPDLADQLIDRIQYAAQQATLKHPRTWVLATIRTAVNLRQHSKPMSGLFDYDKLFDRTIHLVMRDAFAILSPQDRVEVVHCLFVESPDLSLAAELLRHQYAAKNAGGVNASEGLYLTDSELKCAADGQLNLYNELTTQLFAELSSPYNVLFAWRQIDDLEEQPTTFLNKAMKTDQGLIETLLALKAVTSTQHNGVPHLPEGNLRPFVDTVAIRNRLEKLANSGDVYASQASDLLAVWWQPRESTEPSAAETHEEPGAAKQLVHLSKTTPERRLSN